MTTTERFLTDEQLEQFERDGFLVVRGLLSPDETARLREHFMELHASGPVPGLFAPLTPEESGGDILREYPRFMHPHRADELSKDYMLDARIQNVLRDLLGEEPLAAQSMFYFKPPGARGQALHQDNFYLRVSPGTCMAAWIAVDRADPDNGGMFAVPGSHKMEIQCPHVADLNRSFTVDEVDVPAGSQVVPIVLEAGDAFFFNGSVIHGSYPNTTDDRFRRAFICHYVGDSMAEMHGAYYPLHTFDGVALERARAQSGGICGVEEWAVLNEARRKINESPIQ